MSILASRYELLAGGRAARRGSLSLRELVELFMADAVTRYDPRPGQSNNECKNVKDSTKGLLLLYGDRKAADFGPLQAKALQYWMVDQGWCCSTINGRMKRVRRIFRWAVGRAMLGPDLLKGLEAVEPVRQAPQPDPVAPVPIETVKATWPHMGPVIHIMSNVQLLVGCRPGSLCAMRGEDFDRTGKVWRCRLSSHKTRWRTHRPLTLWIGPQAATLIEPYLRPGPIWLSSHGTQFTTDTYGQAIRRACVRAGTDWSANQLRHTAATMIRQRMGIEAAQAILGHESMVSTLIYADRNEQLAQEAALRFG